MSHLRATSYIFSSVPKDNINARVQDTTHQDDGNVTENENFAGYSRPKAPLLTVRQQFPVLFQA